MVFHLAAYRVRGASHRKAHTPCQDACRVGVVQTTHDGGEAELVVGAIADGGGSRPLSHIGARLSVSFAASSMKLAWNAETLQRASAAELDVYWRALYEDCRRLLQVEAEARDLVDGDGAASIGALACTLIAFMATRERCAMAQVGDGFLVVGRPSIVAGGEDQTAVDYQLAVQNRASERASEVIWLTETSWESDFRTRLLDGPIDLIVASSDGMEKAVLTVSPEQPDMLHPHMRYFEQLREGCKQTVVEALNAGGQSDVVLERYLADVLTSPRLDDRTDDDKSMVLALWLEQAG